MLKMKKIHKDERGEIYLIEGKELQHHEEVTIFTCKQGFARGGCIHHKNDEHCTVLEGEVHYYIGNMAFPYVKMKKGDTVKISRGTPHYFLAYTDCIVMEWGATKKEKEEKHMSTRKIVDEINERQTKN